MTTRQPAMHLSCSKRGRTVTVPTFTDFRSMGEAPRSTPAALLQVHRSLLWRLEGKQIPFERSPNSRGRSRTAATQIHQVTGRGFPEGASITGSLSLYFPILLARPTVSGSSTAPLVVRAAPGFTRMPVLHLPSASRVRCDGTRLTISGHTEDQRLVAH